MSFSDFFSGYAQQMQAPRKAVYSGDIAKADSGFKVKGSSHNAYSLSLLEKGKLQFLSHSFKLSQKTLATANQKITQDENNANIQISKGLKKAAALASNDSAIPYDVPHYEKSMLHTYQALNYLYQQNLEGALVEVRRANLVQNKALKTYENDILEAKKDISNSGVDLNKVNGSYPSMSEVIGEVKNGFQNAYTFYLSGLLYEAAGEPNDAYIDYKKALEIFSDNTYLQQDVLRLATKLGMQDDLARFKAKFGQYTAPVSGNGQVVLVYEEGFVNAKDDISLHLPIFTSGDDLRFFSFSLPVYRKSTTPDIPLVLNYQDKVYKTEKIVEIQSLAAKNLEDQLPRLIARQALRLVAKEQMRKQVNKETGDIGGIITSLYNVVSEKADTRSWTTLPARVEFLKVSLPVGKHKLMAKSGSKAIPMNITVKDDGLTFVHVTVIGNYTHYQTINL